MKLRIHLPSSIDISTIEHCSIKYIEDIKALLPFNGKVVVAEVGRKSGNTMLTFIFAGREYNSDWCTYYNDQFEEYMIDKFGKLITNDTDLMFSYRELRLAFNYALNIDKDT